MPVITVEIVADAQCVLPHGVAQSLADAAGRVLATPPGQTWVRVRTRARDAYAENDAAVDPAGLPVFVSVLKRTPPAGAELDAEIAALTQALAAALGRPAARVHVEYAPAAAGRVAFGGRLVR